MSRVSMSPRWSETFGENSRASNIGPLARPGLMRTDASEGWKIEESPGEVHRVNM